ADERPQRYEAHPAAGPLARLLRRAAAQAAVQRISTGAGAPQRLLSLPAAGHYDARSRGGSLPVSVGAGYQGRLLRGAFYSDLFPGAPAGRYQPLAVRTGRGVGDLSPDRHQYADPLPACGLSQRRAAAYAR